MRHACLFAALLAGASCHVTASTSAGTGTPAATPAEAAAPKGGAPATRTDEVTDTYHGVAVADPYRWLETWDDPEVKAWSEAQNQYARSILDALPAAAALRPQVEAILAAKVVSYGSLAIAGKQLFASKRQPPKPQPLIVVMSDSGDPSTERVLLDPSALDETGGTSVDWFRPSPNGKLIAISLSKGGSESGDVHLFDVATGKDTGEIIERVNGGTAGGDLAWKPDSSGFYYTRYPREGERPPEDLAFYQQLWFHLVGHPIAEDKYELGKDLPRVAEIQLTIDPKSGRLLATVQKGDGGEFAHFVRQPSSEWMQFSDFGDRTVAATFGPKGRLYVVSRAGAPRGKLLATSAAFPKVDTAEVFVPEGPDTIYTDFWGNGTIVATNSRVYVTYQTGGPSEIRAFDRNGKPIIGPKTAPISAVHELVPLGRDDLLFSTTSYTEPMTWLRWAAKKGTTSTSPLSSASAVDFSDIEVRREMATSKDGTQIPVNILMRKGTKLDGDNPCLVTGYGGYGVSLMPYQRSTWAVLLDAGFVVAQVNLRGGSEFGDEWHDAGRLTRKQNVFDDFAAALQYMISAKYTSRDKLAIEGGSNGGLLMGATFVQHPEIAKAVVSHVGIYDMLRVELSPNGAFNIAEYGTVKDPAQFKALHAYSPYHHITEGTEYPAVLFMTGANDPRVDPMQSRKMTARLQAASGSEAPILLRTSATTGHGGGTPLAAQVEQTVDAYAFLFAQLGVAVPAGG
jgi:prolyl oligopeptidase